MIKPDELRKIIRNPKTKQIFVYVGVTADDGLNLRISKNAALDLIANIPNDVNVRAIQSVDETTVWIG